MNKDRRNDLKPPLRRVIIELLASTLLDVLTSPAVSHFLT